MPATQPMPRDLPQTDLALVAAAEKGEVYEPSGETPSPEELADADYVAKMPTIQAATLRALCLELWEGVRLDPRGIQLVGARIEGELDLSFATVSVPIKLWGCHFAERPDFLAARLTYLNLSGSRLEKGLRADGVQIEGNLFCRNGFTARGEIRLLGGRVGGDIDFTGATLTVDSGDALSADRLQVEGGLYCRDGFTARGEIRLLGARVGGNIDFSGATLTVESGAALNADRLQVEGGLFCETGFTARGEIRLLGARVGGDIDFSGAALTVGSGRALIADGLQVGGSLFCREKFTINGDTRLVAATIKSVMDWRPKDWNGTLDLRHARVGQWADDWKLTKQKGEGREWGREGTSRIQLDDFTFDAFVAAPYVTTDAEDRLRWLAAGLQGQYVPGPYDQLAKVLRAAGDVEGATRVAVEKRRARTLHVAKRKISLVARWQERGWGMLLDFTVGYGYSPGRGALWLAGLWIVGTLIFCVAGPTASGGYGIIKPAIPMVYAQPLYREFDGLPITATVQLTHHGVTYKLPLEYPPFNAVWYSFDTLIPLIDLGQGSAWSPSPIGGLLRDPAGWLVTGYQYFHIIAGWVLSTLTVVALTGLIKKD